LGCHFPALPLLHYSIDNQFQHRAARIIVKALDQNGNSISQQAEGLLAVCIQHEIDHLEGKLFVDYLSPLKRERVKKKLLKQQRQEQVPHGSASQQASVI